MPVNAVPTVVITIGQLNIGGAERRLLDLVRLNSRSQRPLSLVFFVVSGLPGELDEQFESAGARLVYGRPSLAGLWFLWRVCLEHRPRVLHINADAAAGFYGLAGALAGVRTRIAHFRATRVGSGLGGMAKNFAYGMMTNATCNLHVGVCEAARHGRMLTRPWRTIYNGVECVSDERCQAAAVPPGFDLDQPRVLFIGRLARAKNPWRALEIFASFRQLEPGAQLHIVGPWVDLSRSDFAVRVAALRLENSIVLHGPTDQVEPFYIHSSVCLLTSTSEGLPGTVLESLACGLPVVASDLPGVREIASRLPGVRTRSLPDDDSLWARSRRDSLDTCRTSLRRAFRRGPFQIAQYERLMSGLWHADDWNG